MRTKTPTIEDCNRNNVKEAESKRKIKKLNLVRPKKY